MIRMTDTVNGRRRAITLPKLPDALAAALYKLNEKDESWDNSLLHASDLAASSVIDSDRDRNCQRQLKLRLLGTDEKKQTPGELLMFDQGHAIHERMSQLLELGFQLTGQDGWHVAYTELRATDGLPGEITGTLDVMLYGPNGERVILDYKTKRGNAFNFLDVAKPSNVLQVQAYMMSQDADAGLLLYVDREGQNFCRAFPVQRDDDAVILAQGEIEAIKDSDEIPPIIDPDYTIRENKTSTSVVLKQPWQCDWCRFKGGACPGAVADDDAGKVAGHLEDRVFTPRDGFEQYADVLAAKLERDGVTGEEEPAAEPATGGWRVS